MSVAIDMNRLPEGFVRLAASMPLHGDRDRVAAMLAEAPPWAAGRGAHRAGRGMRRFSIDLRVRLGGRSSALTTFGKAAFLDLGGPRRIATGWEVEVAWQATTAAPLFPVFSGWLTVGPEALRVDGIYAPPGGIIGRVADRMLLHLAANATAEWLLAEIDRAALGAAG